MRTVPKEVGEPWFLVISSSSTSQKHNIFRDTSLFACFFPSSSLIESNSIRQNIEMWREERNNNRKENRKREKKKNKNDGPRKSSGINITWHTWYISFPIFAISIAIGIFKDFWVYKLVKKKTERKLNLLWCKPENESIVKGRKKMLCVKKKKKTRTRLPGLEGTRSLRDISRSCDSRHLEVFHRNRYYR